MNDYVPLDKVTMIGRNEQYGFGVGQIGKRWVGFAVGHTDEEKMLFFFPEIMEEFQMGVMDKEDAIKKAGAIAQDEEKGYGGIEEWYVEERLQADPEEFRCLICGVVLCGGCEEDEDDD
jgi:hypothetical protein